MLGASLLLGVIYVAGRLGLESVSDAIDVLISEGEIAVSDPVDVAVQLALIGAIFWPAAIAATLAHRRSVRSLIAPLHRFRWSIVGKVLTLQIIILIVGTVATLPWLEGIRFTRPGLGLLAWLIPIALVPRLDPARAATTTIATSSATELGAEHGAAPAACRPPAIGLVASRVGNRVDGPACRRPTSQRQLASQNCIARHVLVQRFAR